MKQPDIYDDEFVKESGILDKPNGKFLILYGDSHEDCCNWRDKIEELNNPINFLNNSGHYYFVYYVDGGFWVDVEKTIKTGKIVETKIKK